MRALLAAAALLAACESAPAPTASPSSAPLPSPPATATATPFTLPGFGPPPPPPTPDPTTRGAIERACSDASPSGPPRTFPAGVFDELTRALATHDPFQLASALRGPCVWLAASGDSNDPVVVATVQYSGFGAIYDLTAGGWRYSSAYVGDYPGVIRDAVVAGRRELLVRAGLPGSAGGGSLVGYARTTSGWTQIARSEVLGNFIPEVLDADHIVLDGRKYAPGIPLGFDCNACIPNNYQELWVRSGDRLVRAAFRVVPDPYLSFQIFFGAIRDRRNDRLLRTIADESAIADARRYALDVPEPLVAPFPTREANDVGAAERRHWWALPAARDGPPPIATRVTEAVRRYPDLASYGRSAAGEEFLVELERRSDGWVVTAVRPVSAP